MKHLFTRAFKKLLNHARRGALLLALGAAEPAAWGQSFGAVSTYSTGANSSPYGVAVGDLNRDGRADIVTASGNLNVVTVLSGLPGGGFGATATYATGANSGPLDLTIGDVNGDGQPDIITANYGSNTVGVLLGLAAGGFTPVTTYSTGTNSGCLKILLSDVNSDGRPDIVTANYGNHTAGVLLGMAGGSFAAVSSYVSDYATGPASGSVGLASGDVNGDGRVDIVTANGASDTVAVLLGLAGGGFAAATTNLTGPNSYPGAIALGDVNSDGRIDIVTANSNSSAVGVLLGLASGSFAAVSTYSTGTNSGPVAVALADINGDGRPDIVTTNFISKTAAVLVGLASSGFAAASTYSTGVNSNPQAITLSDVNGDRRPDIVTVNYNLVSVLLNTGTYTPLATTRPTAADISLAPNPAHGAFTVQLPAAFGSVQAELLNALGQVVRRPVAAGPSFQVETSGLAPGIYTLRLQAGGVALARRVVVE